LRTSAQPRPGAAPSLAWRATVVASLQRAAETVAVVGSVTLCVVVAGPGGALEHLFLPLFGSIDDPVQRLSDLAFGIPLAVLLVPGLGMWAWGPRLRPSGTALTALGTLAATVDLAVADSMSAPMWVLLVALWLLVIYQILTFRLIDTVVRRPLALVIAAAASALPWFGQAGRLLVAQLRAGGLLQPDFVVVIVLTLAIGLLLVLPLVRLNSFASAGMAAAVGAVIYALISLIWDEPGIALPRALAIVAVAAAIAYVDTVRHLMSGARGARDARSQSGHGPTNNNTG
jgi:hypothetical protein